MDIDEKEELDLMVKKKRSVARKPKAKKRSKRRGKFWPW